MQVAATSTIGLPDLITTLAYPPGREPPDQFAVLDQRLPPPVLLKYFWPNAVVETNKKVSFNNIVQVKTIPNNDQNKKQQVIYNELQTLQNIYGQDLEKEKINQERILADIKRQKQMEHFLKLQAMLDNMKW